MNNENYFNLLTYWTGHTRLWNFYFIGQKPLKTFHKINEYLIKSQETELLLTDKTKSLTNKEMHSKEENFQNERDLLDDFALKLFGTPPFANTF